MGKICKSCGNYYSGEYCDKCGYGKPAKVCESVRKYRKAARRKPERMQTAEDKKLYAKWDKEEKQELSERARDPKARQHFLIVVLIAACIVIGYALYSSGAIMSNTREEVIRQYFNSITASDYDKFVKCFPKEIRREYDDDRNNSGLGKKEYMQALYEYFTDRYGEGYAIELEFGNEKKLETDDYDMSSYKAEHGSAPRLSEVYEVVVNAEFRGTKDRSTTILYLYVGRTGSYWHIFGMDEDIGMQNADGTENQGEKPPVVNNGIE